jgi:hypothetical protein
LNTMAPETYEIKGWFAGDGARLPHATHPAHPTVVAATSLMNPVLGGETAPSAAPPPVVLRLDCWARCRATGLSDLRIVLSILYECGESH